MARNHYSYQKRSKELEKQKKKEAKRAARAEAKAAAAAGQTLPEPIISIDEFGNVVETWPENPDEGADAAATADTDRPTSPDEA